mgnify:CR=1 FL=1
MPLLRALDGAGELVGPQHVAFGTDMEGAGPGAILSNYVDLREVADKLVQRSLTEATLHSVFIGNYARIVKAAEEAERFVQAHMTFVRYAEKHC